MNCVVFFGIRELFSEFTVRLSTMCARRVDVSWMTCGGACRNHLCKYSSILILPATDDKAALMHHENTCGARERLKGRSLNRSASHWKAIHKNICVIDWWKHTVIHHPMNPHVGSTLITPLSKREWTSWNRVRNFVGYEIYKALTDKRLMADGRTEGDLCDIVINIHCSNLVIDQRAVFWGVKHP